MSCLELPSAGRPPDEKTSQDTNETTIAYREQHISIYIYIYTYTAERNVSNRSGTSEVCTLVQKYIAIFGGWTDHR